MGVIMCKHIWTSKQLMGYGASYLCDRCGSQLQRLWDIQLYSEEEADEMDLVEDCITNIEPTSTEHVMHPF
jgi:hypothetical protein